VPVFPRTPFQPTLNLPPLREGQLRNYQNQCDVRVRTTQERVGRSKKFLYRIVRFSMIELFKEAFPKIFSEKKVDSV
jgi:hypothetical protein